MKIPEPFQIFFAELFDCKETDFNSRSGTFDDIEKDEEDKKILKMTSLYQTMYYILHKGKKKTPLHVMNGIAVHDACRSSTLIRSLNHIGVSISYDEVLRYRCDLANFIVENSADNVPIPSHFDQTQFTIGAFDNFDHNENTISGLGSSHDTVSVLFQEKSLLKKMKPKISETSVFHGNRTFREELKCQKVTPISLKRSSIKIPENFIVNSDLFEMNDSEYKKIECKDLTWMIARMNPENEVGSHEQVIPSWSAFNASVSNRVTKQQIVGFMPLIPNPVTEFSTVYLALCNFKNVLGQLQQTVLPVACDEGVYNIAEQIILQRPDEFKNIFLMLGTFHMSKIVLACVGKYLKGSGVESIFVETSVFGVNVINAVLNGTNYVRSFKGLLLLGEAMFRLQITEFFQKHPLCDYDANVDLHELRKCFQQNEHHTEKMNNVLASIPSILHDFKEFTEKRSSESELYKYWNNVLKMITLLRDLVRSDREGNWLLHVHTVQKLLPIFAAFDRTNYLRWGSLYLERARKLEATAPEVFEKFMEGGFVVQRSKIPFTAVAADMCLEQTINKSKKSASGVIGITRQKTTVTEWEIIYHEILAISNMYRHLTNSTYSENYDLKVHHDSSENTSNEMEFKIKKVMAYISEHENPFSPENKKLKNIVTQQIVEDSVKDRLLDVFALGNERYETFRLQRFINKIDAISKVIHKTNIQPFNTVSTQRQSSFKVSKKGQAMAERTIQVAREREYPLKELLKYELVDNLFLFDETGLYTKTNKSTLSTELEKVLTEKDLTVTSNLKTCYIVDFMACARKISLKSLKNFGDFFKAIGSYLRQIIPPTSERIDFIFDSYFDKSPKSLERLRRDSDGSITLHSISNSTPVPIQKDMFWSSNLNKVNLQNCFKAYILEECTNIWPNTQVFCSATSWPQPTPCVSNQSSNRYEELQFNHIEEADIRILPHTKHAIKNDCERIKVLSNDTDVLVVLLHHWDNLKKIGLKELWIRLGVGNTTRQVPVHTLAERLDICHVLPALHFLTGSDCTSKFGTKHAAITNTPNTYLANFGITGANNKYSIEEQVKLAEEYLVQVLKRGSHCKTMDELRFNIYTQSKNVSIDKLPPTSKSVKLHILRAFYHTHLYQTCLDDNVNHTL